MVLYEKTVVYYYRHLMTGRLGKTREAGEMMFSAEMPYEKRRWRRGEVSVAVYLRLIPSIY